MKDVWTSVLQAAIGGVIIYVLIDVIGWVIRKIKGED